MINIAILGFGNIGSGVAKVLENNRKAIYDEVDDSINIKYILDKRDLTGTPYEDRVVDDFNIILSDPEVSVVCEMFGGTQPAFDFSLAALKAGKCVVTSNKEVVAKYGVQLLAAAKENNVRYLYEASVGGGIPIVHAMKGALAGSKVLSIDGILNGTTNYILSRMKNDKLPLENALSEAQRLGYAEANPKADICGSDSCRKICILAALAWGKLISSDKVHCEGIENLTARDNESAEKFGGVVKLIASAKKKENGIYLCVSPCIVMQENPLTATDGVFNSIMVNANDFGNLLLYGMGAGKLPTASAVMSDIIDASNSPCSDIGAHVWQSANSELLSYEETPNDWCVYASVSDIAKSKAAAEKLHDTRVVYAENNRIAFICRDISKVELLKTLSGFNIISLMRAVL